MKPLRLLAPALAAALLFSHQPARAQEAAPAAPTAAPSPTPATEPEVTLIPEQVPEKKKPEKAEKSVKTDDGKSKTADNEEEMLERIHFRQAHTKAQRDPKVQTEWERAAKARTDLEKREALKSYYKLLHARILAIDPSVKKTSDLRRAASLRRLEQTRIDPTEPLDPQERAERFERASE